ADCKRDVDDACHLSHDVLHCVPTLLRCRDVEENQLVSSLLAIFLGKPDRVAGVLHLCKVDALYHPAVVYVKARYYPLCKRHASAFALSTVILPSYSALPSMTELQPALLTLTTSFRLAMPPLAIILADLAASARVSTSAPCSVPSRSMLVSKN